MRKLIYSHPSANTMSVAAGRPRLKRNLRYASHRIDKKNCEKNSLNAVTFIP